jgi:hypothetical protein
MSRYEYFRILLDSSHPLTIIASAILTVKNKIFYISARLVSTRTQEKEPTP